MEVPTWLSKDLLEQTLRDFFSNQRIVIKQLKCDKALPLGENYLSDIFRTSIYYTNDESSKEDYISLIAKCGNQGGMAKQTVAIEMGVFEKECEMYSKTLPELYKILGENSQLAAKCLYTNLQPDYIIVLEDLKALGYTILPRQDGLDLDHCFKVMEKIAEMHASSAVLSEKDPSSMNAYHEGLFQTKIDGIMQWLKAGMTGLSNACAKWPGYEKYGTKISSMGDELVERGLRAAERSRGGLNVLNHGDLWLNNMMFYYDENGTCKDTRFLDFQMSQYTSPAIDLNFFIATSLNVDVNNYGHIDILLDYYYNHLVSNFSRLKYPLDKVPSRQAFRKDVNDRAPYGFAVSVTTLPLVKAARRHDATFENQIYDETPDGFRHHVYNNAAYRRYLEFLLPYFDSLGILD